MSLPPARAQSDESDATINVEIVYADYLDLDWDGREDDVYVIVRFDLGYSFFYEFVYVITLTLPSGIEYSYLVLVWAWVDTVYTHNLFYDHATENGNYTVYVEALLVTPGIATDTGLYTFDPPGGSEGGKPTFGVY